MRRPSMMIAFLLAFLSLNWACSEKESTPEQKRGAGQNRSTVSEVSAVQERGDRVPNFAWTDGSGRRVTFDEFHAKVTVLNFWATWCGPCRKEIPDLEAIHKEYEDEGVKVIGISVDRGPSVLEDVTTFARNYKMTYPVVIDNGELEQNFGNIRAIPTTFVINKDGKIVERLVGMRSKEVFLKSILPHL